MERPNIPALLRQAHDAEHRTVELTDVPIMGHETVVRRDDGGGLPGWLEALFALTQRNSVHVSDFLSVAARQSC
jgi:KUP system potassium uptake protein